MHKHYADTVRQDGRFGDVLFVNVTPVGTADAHQVMTRRDITAVKEHRPAFLTPHFLFLEEVLEGIIDYVDGVPDRLNVIIGDFLSNEIVFVQHIVLDLVGWCFLEFLHVEFVERIGAITAMCEIARRVGNVVVLKEQFNPGEVITVYEGGMWRRRATGQVDCDNTKKVTVLTVERDGQAAIDAIRIKLKVHLDESTIVIEMVKFTTFHG